MATTLLSTLKGEASLIRDAAAAMRVSGLRTLSEFAEDEIIVPDGPFAGRRFRLDRSPAARLLFAELELGRWQRAFFTGPNQDGKTLILMIILCYLLFERRETVIFGVPTLDIAGDKWRIDLLPVIRASNFRDQLPSSGSGSRGGNAVTIEFANGQVLKYMTAGGDDQSRAAFTTPNLAVTEADGFDEIGSSSREGDKFSQLEKRTLAYSERARVYAECTVTTESGRTWQEYQAGTASRIALRCPHCRHWVTPEREHFVGWQDAESEIDAQEKAHIACPACGATWTDDDRIAANHRAVLVHRGQSVDDHGAVIGPLPRTNTLGFRWTVVNSILNPRRLAMVAGLEWKAKRTLEEDTADRNLRQSQWTLPTKPPKSDVRSLDAFVIMRRTLPKVCRGFCPPETESVSLGCDIGKRLCHWVAIAWRSRATPHIIDYGRIEVPSDLMGEEDAILSALREWRDEVVVKGWDRGGSPTEPTFKFIDRGNWPETILKFCQESGEDWYATMGYAASQRRSGATSRDTGSSVVERFDNYALIERTDGHRYLEINVDHWKSFFHARLTTPIGRPGALTVYDGGEHLSLAKHFTAEKQREQFVPGTGVVIRWEQVSVNNHFLDAAMNACVAGHAAGARLVEDDESERRDERPTAASVQRTQRPSSSNWINSYKGMY